MIPIAKPLIGDEEKAAVLAVLESGMLAQGPRVAEFEREFAAWSGASYAVAVSSGTSALHIALLAHGIGSEDEVITTPFSFIASANSILYTGARPVFADIEPDYFTLDPESVLARINANTRAIVAVHLFGQPCDMQRLAEIADAHNLILIQDACQSHGARIAGQSLGSLGTACYSFYPTKNMTTGEGGMITTNDEEFAQKCRLLREHGMRKRYVHETLGYNLRMTDIQAAIGLAQLHKIDQWNQMRQANAAYLTAQMAGIPGVVTPNVRPNAEHVFHQYTLRLSQRDAVIHQLEQAKIGYGIHYPLPIHQQQIYQELGYRDQLPHAEQASREVLSLPVHPALGMNELETIAGAVQAAILAPTRA